MEMKLIELANLSVSTANMRGAKKLPDLTNILPSVRARGILVPLIVRANGQPDHYEIVAGKRRYHAALVVAEEAGGIDPLPCAVMKAGDDSAENRLDYGDPYGNRTRVFAVRGRRPNR